MSIFISYSSKDIEYAKKIVEHLRSNNKIVWFANDSIEVGDNYAKVITNAIQNSSCLLLLFSDHAQNSIHVPRELGLAIKKNIDIYPLRLEDILPDDSMKYYLETLQWHDLFYKDFDDNLSNFPNHIFFKNELTNKFNQTQENSDIYNKILYTPEGLTIALLSKISNTNSINLPDDPFFQKKMLYSINTTHFLFQDNLTDEILSICQQIIINENIILENIDSICSMLIELEPDVKILIIEILYGYISMDQNIEKNSLDLFYKVANNLNVDTSNLKLLNSPILFFAQYAQVLNSPDGLTIALLSKISNISSINLPNDPFFQKRMQYVIDTFYLLFQNSMNDEILNICHQIVTNEATIIDNIDSICSMLLELEPDIKILIMKILYGYISMDQNIEKNSLDLFYKIANNLNVDTSNLALFSNSPIFTAL